MYNSNDINITNSRLGPFIAVLFAGLIAYILIDHKYGNQLFEVQKMSTSLFWGVLSFCIYFIIWGCWGIVSPTTMLIVNEKGIKVTLGLLKRKKALFVPWSKVNGITKTEVCAPGKYTYNSKTKEREQVMISGVKLVFSEKYKSCGFRPFVYVYDDSLYITKTHSPIEEFMKKLQYFHEKSKN